MARQTETPAAAPHRRTQSISTWPWSLVSGLGCEITQGDMCVTDGAGDYGNNEQCTVQALVGMIVSAEAGFSTESGYDYVTIGGTQYSGTSGPVGVAVNAGGTLHWQSDGSVVGSGFTICGALMVPPPPPLPPSPPLPPQPPPVPHPPPNTPGQVFSSRAALLVARNAWCTNSTAAARGGHYTATSARGTCRSSRI
jgi:hypothetical protein